MPKIGFIGLGNMGGPMVANLIAAGHEVRAFDISADAVARATEAGAVAATSGADAAKGVGGGDHHVAGGQACALGLSGG